MAFSDRFKVAVLSEETDEVLLWLLTIKHVESGTTYRIVNNLDDIVSRGNTFMAMPFKFALPDDDGYSLPQVSIEIDNVGLELMDLIRSYGSGLDLTSELVLAATPDVIEYTIEGLTVRAVEYDAQMVTLQAQVEDLLNQRFPADDFLPRSFSGMFR